MIELIRTIKKHTERTSLQNLNIENSGIYSLNIIRFEKLPKISSSIFMIKGTTGENPVLSIKYDIGTTNK